MTSITYELISTYTFNMHWVKLVIVLRVRWNLTTTFQVLVAVVAHAPVATRLEPLALGDAFDHDPHAG